MLPECFASRTAARGECGVLLFYRTSRKTESTPKTQAKVAKVLATSAAWSGVKHLNLEE
jgi:hypothetical protein